MKKLAMYLRISQDKSGKFKAPDRQRTTILKKINSKKWEITEYLDNDISASGYSRKVREQYNKMVEEVKAGRVDTVAVWDLDRLTREPRDIEDWIEWGETYGVRIISVTENVDTKTAAGRLHLRTKGNLSAHESELKSTRIKASHAQRYAKGKPMKGKRPFGYEKNGMTPRPAEAKYVVEIHERIMRLESLNSIAQWLNAEGVKTPGGEWNKKLNRHTAGANDWSATQVRSMIRKPRFAGLLVVNGEVQPKSKIQAIVTLEQHEAVRRILDARSFTPSGPPAIVHWASGLADCGVCGQELRGKNVSTKGGRLPYYVCSSKLDRKQPNDGTRHVSIRGDLLEDLLTREVASAFIMGRDLAPTETETITAIYAAREALAARREEILGLRDTELISSAEAVARLTKIKADDDALDTQLTAAIASNARVEMLAAMKKDLFAGSTVSIDDAADLLATLETRFMSMSAERKQQLARELLAVRVTPGKAIRRVKVRHLKATSLNDPAEQEADELEEAHA